MGFKGSPGFMAPEILKYVGLEACTEKVDIFSYAMFLYEMISLYFPFEKQNLMKAQIEKLVTEEERPSLQSRVSSVLFLYTLCAFKDLLYTNMAIYTYVVCVHQMYEFVCSMYSILSLTKTVSNVQIYVLGFSFCCFFPYYFLLLYYLRS